MHHQISAEQNALRAFNSKGSSQRVKNNKPNAHIHVLVLTIIEAIFLQPSLSKFLGIVLLALFAYLYLYQRETMFVTYAIIVANDALGTAVLGKLSFTWILAAFCVYEIVVNRKIRGKTLLLCCVAFIMSIEPFAVAYTTAQQWWLTFLCIIAVMIQYEKHKNSQEFFEKSMSAIAMITFLIALHACITGGVDFGYIAGSNGFSRKGVLGAGAGGDANCSGLLLCTGFACVLNSKSFSPVIKLVISLVIVGALTITLSTSSVFALLIIVVLSSCLNKKLSKTIRGFVIVLMALLVSFSMYQSLPSQFHIPEIDVYISRVEMQVKFLLQGNVAGATTNRSELAAQYWDYIANQSGLRKVFGWNPLLCVGGNVAHNTYIDLILQFGYLGAMPIMIWILWKGWKSYSLMKTGVQYGKGILVLKVLYIFFSLTLSIFSGPQFAMWFLVLMVF